MVYINTNDPDITKYSSELFRGNKMILTKEFLKSSNVRDIVSIPISSGGYINESKNIKQEKIENIMFPEMLSPLQKEYKFWHDKLSQLHPKSMFTLSKLGVLQ